MLRRAILRVAPRGMDLDVDDIEQEARLRVWRALQRETTLEQPASYLYRVAVNATLNAVRKRRSQRELALETTEPDDSAPIIDRPDVQTPSPEHRIVRRDQRASIRSALGELVPNRRRAVGLHLQGFTTTEIGSLCGWTEAKARNLAYRGLDDLRRHFKREGDDLGTAEVN